jgi:protein transport protein SEC61 subunit alpha
MRYDLITNLRQILELMPTVPEPTKHIDINQRIYFTVAALALYLACTLTPLYGVMILPGNDPMSYLNLMTGASKFTLMEHGIGPIISSGMALQFLAQFGFIQRDSTNPESRALFTAAQKLAGLGWSAFSAMASIMSGAYGPPAELGTFRAVAIFAQLLAAALIVILLDELLHKGYGIGSGISLFICTTICENIVWRLFSFNSYHYGRGVEFEGALTALFHLLVKRPDKWRALREAFWRPHLPNLASVFGTLVIFVAVILLENVKVMVGLTSSITRQEPKPFEIPLFYCSNTPLIYQGIAKSQLCGLSKMVASRWPASLMARLLGVWRAPPGYDSRYSVPVAGLVYFLQAPTSVQQTIADPWHTVTYLVICLTSAGVIALFLANNGEQSPVAVAKHLRAQRLTLPGCREDAKSLENYLEKFIPPTAAIGGVLTGLLSFVADFLGAFGSGTGIILAVSISFQFFQELDKEFKKTGRRYWFSLD